MRCNFRAGSLCSYVLPPGAVQIMIDLSSGWQVYVLILILILILIIMIIIIVILLLLLLLIIIIIKHTIRSYFLPPALWPFVIDLPSPRGPERVGRSATSLVANYISLSLYIYIYTHVYVCRCIYIYIYMCVYIYIYIYTYILYVANKWGQP